MVWRVGARVHAFMHGLWRPGEAELVHRLYCDVEDQFRNVGLRDEAGRSDWMALIVGGAAERLGLAPTTNSGVCSTL